MLSYVIVPNNRPICFTKRVIMLSTKEFYQNVTDRKRIFFNQRNIIVSDRLLMLCNEISSLNPISTGGRCFPRKFCLPVDNFF